MEIKENQRVMLTKRLIRESLVRMLGAKSIYRISIRELCENAEINRTTFYKYYGSQYDVLNEIEAELLNHIHDALARISNEPVRQMEVICSYLEQHVELFRLLTNNNVDPEFPGKLFDLPPIRRMLLSKLDGRYDERGVDYVLAFLINGGYQVLREWIAKEEREPPAMIAALVLELEEKVCR